ncbi:MAG: heme lyase CcmF/NrfE family subunit, partial [Candidatus Zixiibacteriota bacterium]
FFILLLVFSTSPFERLSFRPQDGQGLNPMLQNPGMVIHPPTLYLGYVGFTIPFAFALAALITGRLGSQWITSTRRWTLFSWFFLTLGNLFGAQWAYVELGWGGYWAWDPVENASFMPWLVGTAYLHSVMIQERRGMLKIWNMILIFITFALTIFGTFITRSGIISSVHSFGLSNLGPLFLIFLGITLLVSFWLLLKRWNNLKSENQLDSLLSRESSFLFNNLILLGLAFAVFWGTIFPIISEAVKGVKITVGPPFFNQVSVPIALMLLLLTGLCPLVGWRRTSANSLRRNFRYPTAAAVVGGGMLFSLGIRQFYPLVSFILCIFVATSIVIEFYRGTRARQKITGARFLKALYTLMARNKRRYGGYIIHLGMVMIFVGITGSSAFKSSVQTTLKKGESVKIKNYEIKYENLSQYPTKNKLIVSATLAVFNNGKRIDTLTPAKEFYSRREQPSTEVDIRSTLKEDLYTILVSHDQDSATFKILVNPLVKWFWIGGYVLTFGTIIAMGREKRKLAEI